jgi:hypothetical protein
MGSELRLHGAVRGADAAPGRPRQQRQTKKINHSQRQRAPNDHRSGKATRGTWETRHRAGGHGRRPRHREAAGNTIASRHCPIDDAPRARARRAPTPCRQLVLACVPRRETTGGSRGENPRLFYPQPAGCPRLGESVWPLLELGLRAADVSWARRWMDGWIMVMEYGWMRACVRARLSASPFESASISVMIN